jgi:hypothetical protein
MFFFQVNVCHPPKASAPKLMGTRRERRESDEEKEEEN